MAKRRAILVGMAAGLLWGVVLLWLGTRPVLDVGGSPVYLMVALMAGFALAGLPLLALIARLAALRFFNDEIIDGQLFAPGSAAEIDQRVLTNTVEQLVLAMCLWPVAALNLGPAILVTLGAGFFIARLCFWIGYHRAPPLRAFGFAATFYPTILAGLLAAVNATTQLL